MLENPLPLPARQEIEGLILHYNMKKAMMIGEKAARKLFFDNQCYVVDSEKQDLAFALLRLYSYIHDIDARKEKGPDDKWKWEIYAEMRGVVERRRREKKNGVRRS